LLHIFEKNWKAISGIIGNSEYMIELDRIGIVLHEPREEQQNIARCARTDASAHIFWALQTTWILPDAWPQAKCARSAAEDRDSPAARRAAKHKTSVPVVLCPRSSGA
jgi:hypothetical protein